MNALLIVDIQNDFLPGGALAVNEGDQLIPLVNQLAQLPFDNLVATQDWHPHDHLSFAEQHHKQEGEYVKLLGINQRLWPVHCVQETPGACFPDSLNLPSFTRIFQKGTDRSIDSYSAFFDNAHAKSTGLDLYLKARNVHDIYIAGLATDYCIKHTALDAKKLGFQVYVIVDACRAVNLQANDEEKAFQQMHQAAIKLIRSSEIHLAP